MKMRKEAKGAPECAPEARMNRGGSTRRLTVAYVVHTLAPGGLERCAAWLSGGLNRQRFQPLIVSLTTSSVSDWIADDVPVIELCKPEGNSLGTILRLSRVLRKHRVDIVHSHSWPTLIECVAARRLAGTPVHLHAEHGTLPTAPDVSPWRKSLRRTSMRWGLGQANRVIAVAEAIRAKIHQFCYFPRQRISIIPNGVDLRPPVSGEKCREAIRSGLGISNNSLVVGSVGRIAAVKGFDILLASFAELAALREDTHLLLVGDGPEFTKLSRLALDSPYSGRIHLVGHQATPSAWLRAMDIYVNSSHSEGLSLAVLEAMGVGLPLVVTNVGDHSALVSGPPRCGLTAPPNDSKALAGAILKLLNDRPLRDSTSRNARDVQQSSYSIEAMIANYEKAYASLVDRDSSVDRAAPLRQC